MNAFRYEVGSVTDAALNDLPDHGYVTAYNPDGTETDININGPFAVTHAVLIGKLPALLEVAKMVDAWGNGLRHETAHESRMVKAAREAISTPPSPVTE